MFKINILLDIQEAANAVLDPPFIKYRNSLGRIQKDHLQRIYLDSKGDIGKFDIGFGTFALCDPYCTVQGGHFEFSELAERYDLNFYDYGFPFRPNPEQIPHIRKVILACFDTYVLPFFRHSYDAATALSESKKMIRFTNELRLERIALEGIEDGASNAVSERIAYASDLFYLAMRVHDVDFMKNHLEAEINSCRKEIARATERIGSDFYQHQKIRFTKRMEKLEEQLQICNNPRLLNQIIAENEQRSLAALPQKIARQFGA